MSNSTAEAGGDTADNHTIENDQPDVVNVLNASELADGDSRIRTVITGAKAYRRSPSKDNHNAQAVALRKALTKDRHQTKSGKGRGEPKKGKSSGCHKVLETKLMV